MEGFKIFVVEDDPWYADILKYHLSLNPMYEVECFATGSECLSNLYRKPTVITVDYSLPDMIGKELLRKILEQTPSVPVIIISGQKDITTAIELIKNGAYDYIVKDEDTHETMWNSLRLLQETLKLREENEKLKQEVARKYDYSDSIIGDSPGIRDAFKLIEKASMSKITVSITGETGTGKDLVAKAIHYNSERRKYPFVAINLSTIPRDLLESELFGYEKGAFTGASSRKTGLFEDADKGTIFLDEIAEMEPGMQAKLLRVLQEKEIRRLGGNQSILIDARVITATHKDLSKEVQDGNFRADLYYRLMGLQIGLVPLRQRGNDILLLARHFADIFCRENNKIRSVFTESAMKKLMSYSFPGNVRELKAMVELAIVLSDDEKIHSEHLSLNPAATDITHIDDESSLDEHIVTIIKLYLRKYDHNVTTVANKLNIGRATMHRYIKKYKL